MPPCGSRSRRSSCVCHCEVLRQRSVWRGAKDVEARAAHWLVEGIAAHADLVAARQAERAAHAFRVRDKGWGSMVTLDGASASGAGGITRLQTPDYEAASQRYDVEVSCTGSIVTVAAS